MSDYSGLKPTGVPAEPSARSVGGRRTAWLQSLFVNYLIPIAIGVAAAKGITTWGIGQARVPSGSMYPTIPYPSRILVDHLATELAAPYRGEVVLFHWPDDPSQIFVKRIIGMPGDVVSIHDGHVYINGKRLAEPYLHTTTDGTYGPYKVPPGHYFMLGDNRNDSLDSRFWKHPFVARSAIVGRADLVVWPLRDLSVIR
ncbi:hypothetical protein GCM10010885_14890 [Alicyclobacillus cellulosilyticus]|uniref:Signal peptidase I n=1 Tax=Alicyclobacillus cellulosilyticus TaxID=1003997 RepID=A0A917KDC1_9BACL|nr:signal peptidase I [Alicyclobacillus cellulosilyticus]GGJ06794.1 hypothetical protein GCM10010885_14890 [Alicyclobacillus cellulosilyticus]